MLQLLVEEQDSDHGRGVQLSTSSRHRTTLATFPEPRFVALANAGKAYVRLHLAFKDAFPSDRITFTWDSICAAAAARGLEDVLDEVMSDTGLKEGTIRYVSSKLRNVLLQVSSLP